MTIPEQFRSLPFYHKLAAVLISILAIGYLVMAGKELLSPLLFSCLFSILLLPIARWLQVTCKFPASVAAMVAVLLMVSVIGCILYLVGAQVSQLSSDWPLFKEQLAVSADNLQNWISTKFHIAQDKQVNYVKTATGKILDSGTVVIGATILSLSSMLLFLVFTFIYTFLFLVYRKLILKFLIAVFLEENSKVVYDIVEQVQFIIRKYIVGLLLEMSIVATVVSTAFSIMGINYAILLGIITGLFNLVPYIGIFSALLLSCLVTFATAAAAGKVISVAITLIIVHLIDSNVLLPVIVGSKVKINALITVIGVILGEMIWGISGMFLSIPVIAVLKIIFDRVDSLKPWGILLGEEISTKKTLRIKRKAKVAKEVGAGS